MLYFNASDSYLPCLSILILHVQRKNFFHVSAISYIAMLKKTFQLVFRKVINFSVFYFEANLSLSVFLVNLIMSVYPSPNFLTFITYLSIIYLNTGFTISPCLSFFNVLFLHV